MFRSCMPLLFTFLLVATLRAQPANQRIPVQVRQPIPVQVAAPAGGKMEVGLTMIEFITESRTRTVTVDGQTRDETYEIAKPVTKRVTQDLPWETLRWFDAKGVALDPSEALAQIQRGSPTFISADGDPVDHYFLDFLSNDAILIVSPLAAIANPRFTYALKSCPK